MPSVLNTFKYFTKYIRETIVEVFTMKVFIFNNSIHMLDIKKTVNFDGGGTLVIIYVNLINKLEF